MLDNRYVEGSSTPVTERDAEGNGYQSRKLADGSTHLVLKNFPTEAELRSLAADLGEQPGVHGLGLLLGVRVRGELTAPVHPRTAALLGLSPVLLGLAIPVLQQPSRGGSQPLSVIRSLCDAAPDSGRFTSGITTWFSIRSSFIRMKSAARFTGSSSLLAAVKRLVVFVVAPAAQVAALATCFPSRQSPRSRTGS
jgi:hypothetical protein